MEIWFKYIESKIKIEILYLISTEIQRIIRYYYEWLYYNKFHILENIKVLEYTYLSKINLWTSRIAIQSNNEQWDSISSKKNNKAK